MPYDILNSICFSFISFFENHCLTFLDQQVLWRHTEETWKRWRRPSVGSQHNSPSLSHQVVSGVYIQCFKDKCKLKETVHYKANQEKYKHAIRKLKKEYMSKSFFVQYMVAISNTRWTQHIHNFQFWKLAVNLYGISTRSFQTCNSVFSSSRLLRYTGRVSLYTYPMTNSTRRLDIARSSTVSYKRKIPHHIPVYRKKGLI